MEETNGRPAVIDGPIEEIIDAMVSSGAWIVGTPDDCIEAIYRLQDQSGGFGGLLVQTIDWASRDKMLKSYELLARYVMPHFQGRWSAWKAQIVGRSRARMTC